MTLNEAEPQSILRRVLLKDEVYAQVLHAIVSGELAPGTVLTNAHMERWLGVSRTTLRDAFNRLEAAGLVKSSPNRYTRVTEADPEALEANASVLGMIVAGISDASLREIAGELGEEDVEDPDTVWTILDRAVDAERNPMLTSIVNEQLTPLLRRDADGHLTGAGRHAYRAAGRGLLESAQQRDAAGMRRRMGEMLRVCHGSVVPAPREAPLRFV